MERESEFLFECQTHFYICVCCVLVHRTHFLLGNIVYLLSALSMHRKTRILSQFKVKREIVVLAHLQERRDLGLLLNILTDENVIRYMF